MSQQHTGNGAPATPRTRRQWFSLVWLAPVAALLITGYLVYTTFANRGPLVTVTFHNAEGLVEGQTPVRYRSVQVGTVEGIRLSDDLRQVEASIRMEPKVRDRLTENAQFWVVRPRLSAGNISGLGTLVSGSYVEFDPGKPENGRRRGFQGLEDPPGVRSDEPGRVFTLQTERINSLGPGSPVFFRDVQVGEILSVDPPSLESRVSMRAFVRAPFDQYLRQGSVFWNASGASLGFGPEGIRLGIESVQALISGGVAFETPAHLHDEAPVPDGATFDLFASQQEVEAATSPERISFLTYFDGSVRGLAPGSAVELRGLRIGSVTSVDLEYDRDSSSFRVPVRFAIEPHRISYPAGRPKEEVRVLAERMVEGGVRVQLRNANLLTGQMVVAMDAVPGAAPAQVRMQGEEIVLPSVGGGSDNLLAAAGAIAGKLERFPLEEIGQNLNGLLAAVNGLANGPELSGAMTSLVATLGDVRELVRKADQGFEPLLQRLPGIADNLDQAVQRANAAIGSIESGYGEDSHFNRQLDYLMGQAADAARSLRLLADYLDRHPEALVRGRTESRSNR